MRVEAIGWVSRRGEWAAGLGGVLEVVVMRVPFVGVVGVDWLARR